jgi:colanic acid biosynthesis glycosyl transferase WcaI
MKILILGINYAPELTGIGKYTGEMGEWLSAKGVEVKMITAPPYYPEWEIGYGYRASKYLHENVKGVEVWRCPIWVPKRKNAIRRILHLLSFALSSLPVLLKQVFWKPDVVLVVEPTFFCAPFALIASILSGAKSWLHIQDFEVDASFKLGFLPRGHIYHAVKLIERLIVKRFDRVSTISAKMLEKAGDNGNISGKCVIFPNWADLDKIYPLAECEFFRKEWGVSEETVVVLYSGNMGQKQGLEIIIEVSKLLSGDSNILFVLCGTGAAKEELTAKAAGMNNVRFLPLQPLDHFNKLLNTADIHFLPQRDDASDIVMPSKLTGIFACGGIVIATSRRGTELADVVETAGGILCDPGDSIQMANAVKSIASDRLLQSEMRINARNYAEMNLAKSSILNEFFGELKKLINET